MDDMLTVQKHTTQNYNLFANECETQSLRDCTMQILREEHDIQANVFDTMLSRGWYAPEQADQQQISNAKQKFSQMMQQ